MRLLTEGSERGRRKVGNVVDATLPYLLKPGRVLQQRASDCYQVELAALQPREQPVQRGGAGTLAGKRFVDVTRQADGADRDGGDARELLRPAGKVQLSVDFRESGLPEFWLREVEGVRTSVDQYAKPLFQRLRRRFPSPIPATQLPAAKPLPGAWITISRLLIPTPLTSPSSAS